MKLINYAQQALGAIKTGQRFVTNPSKTHLANVKICILDFEIAFLSLTRPNYLSQDHSNVQVEYCRNIRTHSTIACSPLNSFGLVLKSDKTINILDLIRIFESW